MKEIFYIGEFDFNRKNASAVRIINNCKALLEYGNVGIKIIGYSDVPRFKEGDLSVLNVPRGKNLFLKLFFYIFRSLFVIHILEKNIEKPDVLIYYGASSRILLPLLIYSKVRRIKIVADVVEWQDYSHLHFGRFGPIALDVFLCITRLIPRCDGVIAISSFLFYYYKNLGLPTVRIPVLVDTQHNDRSEPISDFDKNYLNLIYAGFPGQKDLLFNAIDAVEQIASEGILIKLHLLGPTKKQLEHLSRKHFSDAIICYGQIAQEKVTFFLEQADFSVLLRPDKRYAHAGFPTKFVESMNAGLPVIANYTSDLSLFLKDGYNGFVVADCSVNALIIKIKYILSIGQNTFCQLRINARQTAIDHFDYRLFSKELGVFISRLKRS